MTAPFGAALVVELAKVCRSRVVGVASVIPLLVVPAASGAFLALGESTSSRPIAEKARAMTPGTGWEALGALAAQLHLGLGLVVIGVVVSWCVGREFTDGTITTLFARPVPRAMIAAAKLVVLLAWGCLVGCTVAVSVGVAGILLGLPAQGAPAIVGRLAVLGVFIVLGAMPAAWVATRSRGVIAPIAVILGLLVVTQFAVALGVGGWMPWAAGGLWAGVAGDQAARAVTLPQLALAVIVGLLACAAAVRAWGRLTLE